MNPHLRPKLIAGNSNKLLATAIARRISIHRGEPVGLVETRVERFNDQEIFVEVYENVRGEDMFIIQSTSNPANDNLMELLIMTDALRRSSASRITAVMPYFGYARHRGCPPGCRRSPGSARSCPISAMRGRTGGRRPARRSRPSSSPT
jgi:ribose-phosphate pyrophosphokinase